MENHVCPVWVGYFLASPLRKLAHDPEKILGPYIAPGMSVIDYGCAMGYFSIPMAKMVGDKGRVYCFDIQERMLMKLEKRAKRAGVEHIVQPVLINSNGNTEGGNKSFADFALLFAVVHEVPDTQLLFTNLSTMMKTGSTVLIAEPKGHVGIDDFAKTTMIAENAGFERMKSLNINSSHATLFKKSE
ncbi:MAG: methyltransferase domain-containing protein [Bacteroidales bacterium]